MTRNASKLFVVLAAVLTLGLTITAGCVRTYQVPALPAFANTPTPTSTPLVRDITEANFTEEVLDSAIPVVVVFSATWCSHCQAYAPIVDQFARDNAGRIKVVRVDYDSNTTLFGTYSVSLFPTTVFFKNGAEVARLVGEQDLTTLEGTADTFLLSGP
jgi:thioredoxin 1